MYVRSLLWLLSSFFLLAKVFASLFFFPSSPYAQVTTTDAWGEVMYTVMQYKSYAALFFVVQMLIGLCTFLRLHAHANAYTNMSLNTHSHLHHTLTCTHMHTHAHVPGTLTRLYTLASHTAHKRTRTRVLRLTNMMVWFLYFCWHVLKKYLCRLTVTRVPVQTCTQTHTAFKRSQWPKQLRRYDNYTYTCTHRRVRLLGTRPRWELDAK